MSAQTANKKISVGALSMRTYRWIKVNGKELPLDFGDGINTNPSFFREPTYTNVSDEKRGCPKESVYLPEGIEFKESAGSEVFDDIFSDAVKKISSLDEASLPANGDVLIKHMGQKIPTGLGKEVDALMDEENVPFRVYSVADGVKVRENLEINLHPSEKNTLVRQIIRVGKNASLRVLIDLYSVKESSGFLGVQTFILADEGARVSVSQVQMLGEGFTCIDDLGGVMYENAHVKIVRTDLGSRTCAAGSVMNELGKKCEYELYAAYLCRNEKDFDYNHAVTQRGEETKSLMRFNGVLLDKSLKTLRYTIDFREGAKKSEGEEAEDILLLSDDAINRSVPVILCQEEDISGHHGASIGELPEDMLFYMESRGFSEEDARKFIIRAKILDVVHKMPHCLLRKRIEVYLKENL